MEMAPLSMTVVDVRELDNVGGVGYGDLSVAAGNSFSYRPVSIAKVKPTSFAIPVFLFAGPISLFAGTKCIFALFYSHSGFYQDFVMKMSFSMSFLFAVSFRRPLILQTDASRIRK